MMFCTKRTWSGALLELGLLGLLSSMAQSGISREYTQAKDNSESYRQLEAKYLTGIKCRDQVFAQLHGNGLGGREEGSFTAVRQWGKVLANGKDGSIQLLTPTTTVGLWAAVRVYLNKEAQVSHVTASRTRTFSFAADPKRPELGACAPIFKDVHRTFDQKVMKGAFTDHTLLDLLKENTYGVVYVWSPNMPYSFKDKQGIAQDGAKPAPNGLVEITKAVQELSKELGANVKLDIAVDPSSAPALVKNSLKQIPLGLKLDTDLMARPAQAIDLLFRNMNHHYPSLLVYAKRTIARRIYPGVGTSTEFKHFIRTEIANLNAGEGVRP